MIKGNKGEWSELYTLLTLLSDGNLYAADANLEKIEHIVYPLIEILRIDSGKDLKYIYADQSIIIENSTDESSIKIPVLAFKENALLLLDKIKNTKGRSFQVEELESFLRDIQVSNIKSPSGNKTDIVMKVYDPFTGMTPHLGFSIKSKLGSAATLFNAGKTTNFRFKLTGNIDDGLMKKVNDIQNPRKYRKRMELLSSKNIVMQYESISSKNFELNLQMIDSNLPIILANLLQYYYSGYGIQLPQLLDILESNNPCHYNDEFGHSFYEYKIKRFLVDAALGMVPSVIWSGTFDATGGYIVVREDGEILCYHLYNMNEFQEYLLQNVKLDTPSSRNEFGFVYKIDDEYFFDLNLQIRFI